MALWLAAPLTALLAAPLAPPVPTQKAGHDAPASNETRQNAPRPKLKRQAASGLLAAGSALTAASAWSTGMLASRNLDSRDGTKQEMGRALVVPVLGPVLATTTCGRKHWPVAALSLMQVGGLSMLTVGAVSTSRHRRSGQERRRRMEPASAGTLYLTHGVIWFSIAWGMTFGFSRNEAKEGQAFEQRLQIPVVGGIWAAPHAPDYTLGYLGLTSSAIQIASASAIVFGAVVLAKHNGRNKLSLVPVPTRDGAQLVAAMRF